MWAFFSRRLRMWLILVLGAPLAVKLLRSVAGSLEQRRGETSHSRPALDGRLDRRQA